MSLKTFSHVSSLKPPYTGNENFWQGSDHKGFPLMGPYSYSSFSELVSVKPRLDSNGSLVSTTGLSF